MLIDDGVFIELIIVGLYVFYLVQGCEGKNVIIIGVGIIGLLVLQCVCELGVNSVMVIDINLQKLELVKIFGVIYVFNSCEMSGQVIQQVLEFIQFDQLVFEIVGMLQIVVLVIEVVGLWVQLVLVGMFYYDLIFLVVIFGQILCKELNIVGSWMNYFGLWLGEEW